MDRVIHLRHRTADHERVGHCGCRTPGECNHGFADLMAEAKAIDALVDDFADHLKAKLHDKRWAGRSGWDDPAWPREAIVKALVEHVAKGDMLDVAAFAAFAWNQVVSERPGDGGLNAD